MFDFADATGNSVLEHWNFCGFCPLAIVIQEVHKKEYRKYERNNLYD